MRLLKIRGKDKETINEQIEQEYGKEAIILSTTKERKQGLSGYFKKPDYVVTIALPEENQEVEPKNNLDMSVLLQELRSEVGGLRKEVRGIGEASKPYKEPEKTIKKLFHKKLIDEGVYPSVVEDLIGSLSDTITIDEAVRRLYRNLSETLLASQGHETYQKIYFIGPTGVGKTTTIAKLTAEALIQRQKKVALLTADTYRIAAIEQLKTYAEILDVPIEIIYEPKELIAAFEKWQDVDHLLIDTAGRSHKNKEHMEHMVELLGNIKDAKVYLVISMNTQFQDVKKIIETYHKIVPEFELIITKSDETDVIGNLLNIVYAAKKPIAYITNGQGVPEDIRIFDKHSYIKELLGRISHDV